MNRCRIVFLVLLGTTACVETRVTPGDKQEIKPIPASAQDADPIPRARYSAEAHIVAVVSATSPGTELGIPGIAIGCQPGPGRLITPQLAKPRSAGFPNEPTEAECRDLAEGLLPDDWGLGAPIDGVAKCCLVNGIWIPCHPGWSTRAFPVLRGDGPERYSWTITVTSNGQQETLEFGLMAVVTAGQSVEQPK